MSVSDWPGPADLMDPEFVLYEELDPGIRETVRQIRAWGFKTTDSGDGRTKLLPDSGWDPDEVLDIAHVFITTTKEHLIFDVRRLWLLMTSNRWPMLSQSEALLSCADGKPRGYVDATYDPADNAAIIGVYRLTDDMWRKP